MDVSGRIDVQEEPKPKEEEEAMSEESDLAASLEEIEKLDAIIKIKVTEEKKAKLSRIQTEEESRDLLSKLPRFKVPDRIKINVEKFMELLDEVVEADAVSSPRVKLNDSKVVEDGDGKKEGEREEKGICPPQNTKNLTFVERNIRLAKCGRGTLSLTDEEKSRIESLLADVENSESKAKAESEAEKSSALHFYALDQKTRSALSEIDQRLQVLGKLKSLKAVGSELDGVENLVEKSEAEMNAFEENKRESVGRGRKEKKRKVSRLEEINKLLDSMNLATDEEVKPLPEEELEKLLRQSKESLGETEGSPSHFRAHGANPDLPQEVVAQLVSSAKSLMPKFKYRFDDG